VKAAEGFHPDLICRFREFEVLDAAGVEDEAGDLLVGVPRKAHGADVAVNTSFVAARACRFVLEPVEGQLSILNRDAIDGIDLVAHKGAGIVGKLGRGGMKSGTDSETSGLRPRDLLKGTRLDPLRGDEVQFNTAAPGTPAMWKREGANCCNSCRSFREIDQELAVFHRDVGEVVVFAVPVEAGNGGELIRGERDRRGFRGFFGGRGCWRLEVFGEQNIATW